MFPFNHRAMLRFSAVAAIAVLSFLTSAIGSRRLFAATATGHEEEAATSLLAEGWHLQSSCKIDGAGEEISSTGYVPKDWISTRVPATVLAAQVAAGVVPEPYYGSNLRQLPGETYKVGMNFANLPMPADSPYKCSWWYRKEFSIPAVERGRTQWLHFGGINYRANIWLNGKKIADQAEVAGAYRTYDFDITAGARAGDRNVLAIETFAPSEKDLGINWVDWNPCPPDKDMGLWGDVALESKGPVTLRSPLAVTHFADDSLHEADLTVYAELHNAEDHAVDGEVIGTVAGVAIKQPVRLAAHQDQTVVFVPERYPQLKLRNPEIWWPYQMGKPHLEKLALRFVAGGHVSDEREVEFGIREITSELTDKGSRLFRVNGKPILIRGAGWSQDMLLREYPQRLRDEFELVRDMHLNTIRLEGKLETEDFLHLADQQGILVMLGWCCCDQWEHWKNWSTDNYTVAAASLRSQMLRIRSHASLLVWLNGSDNPPPANVESTYLQIEAETHWPNPTLSSASATPTTVSGKSGVKMSGPYDYVAPSYWYVDTEHGGAFGFNTETSPGPAIPNLASLRRFIPADQLWPLNATWSLHNGGGKFKTLDVFNDAMASTYAAPSSAEDYVRLSQTMTYDGERAMFEAYGRNKYTSTGVIQWMLNNAWPSMIWHLFDYYLDADGGYFGTKKACEPLHIQYSYDDRSIFVVNSTYGEVIKLNASVHVYDETLKELYSNSVSVDAAADSSNRVTGLPEKIFSADSKVFFVDLALRNAKGEQLSQNFYWVPAHLTTFDWAKTDFTHTPALQHEDLKSLLTLPAASVRAAVSINETREERVVRVALHNPTRALAFQVVAAVRTAEGGLIAPVIWSDNYVELMPGKSQELTATLPQNAPENADIVISGWNIKPQTIRLHTEHRDSSPAE
jgi:exo-1,4-beta-D-glucosaminidase